MSLPCSVICSKRTRTPYIEGEQPLRPPKPRTTARRCRCRRNVPNQRRVRERRRSTKNGRPTSSNVTFVRGQGLSYYKQRQNLKGHGKNGMRTREVRPVAPAKMGVNYHAWQCTHRPVFRRYRREYGTIAATRQQKQRWKKKQKE
eukprot:4930322-Amphidinium_carterae.1